MAEIRYAPIIGNRGASHGPAQQTRPWCDEHSSRYITRQKH